MSDDNFKEWWAPIRNGLVTDPRAKHIKAMGPALALYLYLHIFANRDKGRLFRKYQTISEHMGIPVATLKKWMKRLKTRGYVKLTSLGDGLSIQITKFRPIRSTKSGQEKYQIEQGEVSDSTRGIKVGTPSNNSEQKSKGACSTSNGTSKESNKESNKEREAVSRKPSSKKTATKSPANPDVKLAIDHFYDEFVRIHGIKPQVNGSACKTFQRLLNTRPIEQVKTLTTGYLSLKDEKLRDKGYPIEWMSNHITGLLLAEKKPERGLVF
jgi:hypothetical protein